MQAENVKSNDRGQPGRTRLPPRLRDVQRMQSYREDKAIEQGRWADSADMNQLGEDLKKLARPRGKPKGPQKQKKSSGIPTPSTSETPPNDSVLYDGNGLGSTPATYQVSQNIDYSGYAPVIQSTYDLYMQANPTFSRTLPFCMFQHYCVEILNAMILHIVKKKRGDPLMAFQPDPILEGQFEEIYIPLSIKEYLQGIGDAISSANELISVNLPSATFPLGPVLVDQEQQISSGSFGPCNVDTHNAYETNFSPYISKRLIERTLEANEMAHPTNAAQRAAYNGRFQPWQPLPADYFPANSTPTLNLLGYRVPEQLRTEGIQELRTLHFYNDDSILGRLCHCPDLMSKVSGSVRRESRIKSCQVKDITVIENSSNLLFKELDNDVIAIDQMVAEYQSNIYSASAFSAGSSNRANYFAYKRSRSVANPGPAYVAANNAELPGWNDTRNNSFNMIGLFIPRNGMRDRASLRERDHRETYGQGSVPQALMQWYTRHFVIDARK